MNVIPCSRLYHFFNGYSGGRKTRERGPGYLPFSSPLSAEREGAYNRPSRFSQVGLHDKLLAIYSSSQGQTMICVHVNRTHVVSTRVRLQIIASICSSEKPPEFYWDHVLDCALATYLSPRHFPNDRYLPLLARLHSQRRSKMAWLRLSCRNKVNANQGANVPRSRNEATTLPYMHQRRWVPMHIFSPMFNSLQSEARSPNFLRSLRSRLSRQRMIYPRC